MIIDIEAFVDELEKISGLGATKEMVLKALSSAKRLRPGHLKYPAVGVGSILAVDKARELKRQRDIGKAYEEAQGG